MPDSLLPISDDSCQNSACCSGLKRTITAAILFFSVSIGLVAANQLIASADDKTANPRTPSKPEAESKSKKGSKPEHEYVRIRKNEKKLAVALETSVITFTGSSQFPGASVDLIGAIHLGEPEYYDRLNELFKKYDVLLFEAVMPEDAVRNGLRPGGGSGANRKALTDEEEWNDAKIGFTAISAAQLGMKEALGMEFQLSGVDYTAKNFVHADMTAEEFESTMSRRGESFGGMFLKEMGKAMAKGQSEEPIGTQLDMMLSALSSDRAFRIRRIAAVQLAKAGDGEAFAGSDGTSTIITERNIKCLDVMRQELRNGRTKVGIFYGAGHFFDMEKRMVSEYGFKRTAEEWLVAWHLRDPKKETAESAPKK